MNAERVLIAAECIVDAKWFTKKSVAYANERREFDRTIGSNQGVQFPIARAYAQMRAAELMVREAARLYEAGESMGAGANMAKMLAAEASWEAANVCVQTHGGFGLAEEYDVERKFRETRLYQVAPTPCWTRPAKAASISRSVPALTTRIFCPIARPAG
jgi:acyl-CoA dehydrogenase